MQPPRLKVGLILISFLETFFRSLYSPCLEILDAALKKGRSSTGSDYSNPKTA
jgi:hypothetical protein